MGQQPEEFTYRDQLLMAWSEINWVADQNNGVLTDDDIERVAQHWTAPDNDHSDLAAELTSIVMGKWKGYADVEETRRSDPEGRAQRGDGV